MSKKANPVRVGSFVLGGILLSVMGLILFGGGKMFERKFFCIAYFEESLSGLDIGAPVEYKGVRIGTVSDVRLIVDPVNKVLQRPVTISLEPNRVFLETGKRNGRFDLEGFQSIVERGLRAKLASQSMLTGKLKIELDFYPDSPITKVDRDEDLPQLPTVLSPLEAAMAEFRSLPFAEIVTEVRELLGNVSALMATDDFKNLVPEVNRTLKEMQGLMAHVDQRLVPLGENMAQVSAVSRKTLEEVGKLTAEFSRLLAPMLQEITRASANISETFDARSSIRIEIEEVLQSLTEASRSFSDLADFLQRHPESLIKGKGGPR